MVEFRGSGSRGPLATRTGGPPPPQVSEEQRARANLLDADVPLQQREGDEVGRQAQLERQYVAEYLATFRELQQESISRGAASQSPLGNQLLAEWVPAMAQRYGSAVSWVAASAPKALTLPSELSPKRRAITCTAP